MPEEVLPFADGHRIGNMSLKATFSPLLKRKPIKINHCHRCDYDWPQRRATIKPKECPECKSRYWSTPRQREREAVA